MGWPFIWRVRRSADILRWRVRLSGFKGPKKQKTCLGYLNVPDVQREAVVKAHPRGDQFKEQIIHAFHDGFCHKPETTFGTVNDDVLALRDPKFKRGNFCSVILNSAWSE